MIAAPSACALLVGPPHSGKTRELLARARAASDPSRVFVGSPHLLGARRLAAHLPDGFFCGTPAALAFTILAAEAFGSGLALEVQRIEDVDAEAHFERAAAGLFSLEWIDLIEPELGETPSIDYEIAGLRAPERFAQAAYRLFRKLRGAAIGPQRFLEIALRKATEWYAHPPNLAHPALVLATQERYRDSLSVDASELERQRRREIDLAKILARTYERYLADSEARGSLTDVDAVAEATRLLEGEPDAASRSRERRPLAFVDDAQDLTVGELALLRALYGENLDGVTLAGDPEQATLTFAGARPDRVFACAIPTLLPAPVDSAGAIAAAARAFLMQRPIPIEGRAYVALHRAESQAGEAAAIAAEIERARDRGVAPERIAVLVRSLRGSGPYVEALLERNIPVRLVGDVALFVDPTVQDALSLLWAAHDPFRHDWLLRALQTPTVRLSDATLASLCTEPAQPQAALFAELPQEEDEPRGRWDRERDLRLGRNVTRGDRDADLDGEARARVARFRALRKRWRDLAAQTPLEDLARLALIEGGLFADEPGERAAWAGYRRAMLERLLARIAVFARADRRRSLGDLLVYLETIAASDWGHCDPDAGSDGVAVAQIDAVKGCFFDEAFVPNLRAGAFPPYWVPDAFVFTTAYGVVPKDNVGDARAARTAKFTWYQHSAKVREHHASENRRLLYCAMTRATQRVMLSAFGPPTKGIAAPELLAEFERAVASR